MANSLKNSRMQIIQIYEFKKRFMTAEVAVWHSPDFPGEWDIFITIWNIYISWLFSNGQVSDCSCIY